MKTSSFKISNLQVGYSKNLFSERKVIIEKISFEAISGDVIAIVGKNGCGKTSLLKTLLGILCPLDGTIEVNEINSAVLSSSERSKIVNAVLTDKIELDYLRVDDLLRFGNESCFPLDWIQKNTNVNDELMNKKLQKILDDFNLLNIQESFWPTLSDGQKQKVLLARVLMQDASVILLDEPTAFLDPAQKIEMVNLFKHYAEKENKIIIFTTHDWGLVLSHVKKLVAIIHRTKCLQIDTNNIRRTLDTGPSSADNCVDLKYLESSIFNLIYN